MIKIKVKIEDEKFKFLSEADEIAFYEIVARDIKPIWQAWDVMRGEGWSDFGREDGYINYAKPENAEDELEIALYQHDWYYQMSDDYRYYQAGKHSWERILDLMKKVGEPKAKELYEKYSPFKEYK